jgi:hypothetical protein
MDLLNTLGSVLGIGLLSGFRLYATVLVLGAIIRLEWWTPTTHLRELAVLADTKVLAVAGAACLLEFLADKVPWIDSFWDSFHTVIRPVGAVLLTTAALGEMDAVNKTLLALLSGGVALAGHSSKAATRLAVNHSPEPFSNIALSVMEDILAPVGLWFALAHPIATLVILSVFLTVFFWLSPKVFRLLRVELQALWALGARWFSTRVAPRVEAPAQAATSTPVGILWDSLRDRMDDIPADHAGALREKLGSVPGAGVYCAATKSVGGLRSSTGYLCIAAGRLAFVTRRWFRWRVHSVDLGEIREVTWRRRLLLDQLTVQTPQGNLRFDVFKVAPSRVREAGLAPAAG